MWWQDLTVEVDGYLWKRGRTVDPLPKGLRPNHRVNAGALFSDAFMPHSLINDDSPTSASRCEAEAVQYPSWPPEDTLGWTPFNSLPFNKTGKIAEGKVVSHFWCKGDSSKFHVRAVGYASKREKKPSAYPLYECVGVDLLQGDNIISKLHPLQEIRETLRSSPGPKTHIPWPWLLASDSLNLPEGGGWSEDCGLPRLLIVNCQLPSDPPSLWGSSTKGGEDSGYSVVAYFVINPLLLKAMKSDTAPKSVGLFKDLLRAGKSTKEGVALKAIGMVENFSELGLPDIIGRYNAKPVLVTKSCKIYPPPVADAAAGELCEMEFDVRLWSYIAKKSLYSLSDRLKEAEAHVGFVVEGKTNDELPEQVLGCFRIKYLDIALALGFPRPQDLPHAI